MKNLQEVSELNVYKRAWVSIRRHFGKVLLLLVLMFLLLTLAAGAISVRQAIVNTDQNLRSQLPAIATLRQDEEAVIYEIESTGLWPELEGVQPELIREIGNLAYVEMFDYTAWGHHFFSSELQRVFYPELYLRLDPPREYVVDSLSFSVRNDAPFENFVLKGVHAYHVVDVASGLINLIDGRTFTELEIEEGLPVVMVSQSFLETNNLYLGGILSLEYKIYNEGSGELVFDQHYTEDNLLASQIFDLEIVGVFSHDLSEQEILDSFDISTHLEILNRIYVPNALIESTVDLYIEAFSEVNPGMLEEILGSGTLEDVIQYENIIFLLADPTYLLDFQNAVVEMLPDFWVVSDLSNAYAAIANSMEMMGQIANGLMLGSMGATLIVISLLIVLFFRERKEEIGIYLALGEKRRVIIFQLLVEVMMVSSVAIILALYAGNVLASTISTTMLRQDLERQANEETFLSIPINSPEAMGFRHEMTHEEMLDAYSVSLDATTTLIFFGVSTSAILLSTIIPIAYITKLNPKDILLKGTIR